jgi:hypothetical protein
MIPRLNEPAPPATLPAIAIIPPQSVMVLEQAIALRALPRSCIPREARLGRLRTSRRAGRLWATGAWLLAWIKGGETTRRRRAKTHAATT